MIFLAKIQRRKGYSGEQGTYGYRRYKQEICEDCNDRCVYCDLHANCLGGYGVMELDHFRPKSKEFYPELKDDPFNLLLACRSCNGKKSNDWPAGKSTETHIGGLGYIDPFDDRQDFFEVGADGRMSALKPPAQYVIDQLILNRALAVAVRLRAIVLHRLDQAAQALETEHADHLNSATDLDRDRLREIVRLLGEIRTKIIQQVLGDGKAL